MAAIGTGNKSVAFANVAAAYAIRDAGPPALIRLDERYADYLQTGFIVLQRSDGQVQDGAAVKLLQHP
jgi:HK97 family phage major capsid protein